MAEEPDAESLARELASLEVEQFVVAAASTLVSLAHAKLEGGDLAQARKAIDTLVSLVPHVAGGLRGDLDRALANLQVGYATATRPPPGEGAGRTL